MDEELHIYSHLLLTAVEFASELEVGGAARVLPLEGSVKNCGEQISERV